MLYLGIDPGLNGAIAAVGDSSLVYSTPTKINSKTGKREFDLLGMRSVLEALRKISPLWGCIIEEVHAMPHQGVTSMFRFGEGFGIWKGLLVGLNISFRTATPQRWKEVMLEGDKSAKETSLAKARKLFPSLKDELARKKDDGRAEALLIAQYCLWSNKKFT